MAERTDRGMVLVVDDDDINRAVFANALELAGFEVLGVATGEDATEICRNPPGKLILIIVDFMLTDSRGTELALHIRGGCPDIPVIITSGTPPEGWSAQDQAALLELGGAEVFLQKPFQVHQLMQKVRMFTNRSVGKN